MTRVLSLLLLGQMPALAAESPAVVPPVFDKQGRPLGPPLSEHVTDYEIDARLEPATQRLSGQETLTWRNRSAETQATDETVRQMERFLDFTEETSGPLPHGTRVR